MAKTRPWAQGSLTPGPHAARPGLRAWGRLARGLQPQAQGSDLIENTDSHLPNAAVISEKRSHCCPSLRSGRAWHPAQSRSPGSSPADSPLPDPPARAPGPLAECTRCGHSPGSAGHEARAGPGGRPRSVPHLHRAVSLGPHSCPRRQGILSPPRGASVTL